MKKLVILLVLSLVVSPLLSSANAQFETRVENINDIDFLVIVSDDCGWSYFIVNETLHEMGVNVITLTNTESYTVTSCPSREPRPITADLLLSEFDLETIGDYDGIVIPAGGQWRYMENDTDVHELLGVAYDNGLVIGSICNGGIAMVRSEVLTNGTKVVTLFPRLLEQLNELGAVMVWNARVVSDNGIVTGDYGAFEIAPIYEVCLEMIKTVMGYSHATNTEVVHQVDMQYQITVEVANLSLDLPGFNLTDVEEIVANIYPESNPSEIIEVELTRVPDTDQYSGNFTLLDSEKHIVDLDIMSEDSVLEVVRNAATFLDETGIPPDMILLLGGGVGIGVVVVVVAVLLRRKS
jgi:putative intracellular protease/amidase